MINHVNFFKSFIKTLQTRAEVWEDKVNPLNNWWESYSPSEEERDAAAQGYDFAHPEKWFEVRPSIYMHCHHKNLVTCLFVTATRYCV